MKIESYTFTHQSEHTFFYEKKETFEEELSVLGSNEPSLKNTSIQPLREIDLVQQMKFTLIQQLLRYLSGSSSKTLIEAQPVCNASALMTEEPEKPFRLFKRAEISHTSTYKESESLSIQTQGIVKTKDGRSISLNLDITMERSFYSKTALSKSVFIDPLVVSLDGTLPQLSDATFSFDLDCDGKSDQISCLAKNSGFLALDTNQNGQIDNGSELFGTKSGNGFKDLSAFDADKNAWIDENDPIFEGLRIWCNDELIGLGEVGLGAIYLGAQPSPYTLKNDDFETLGKLRQSSLCLFESGKIGTIAQIDFAKLVKLKTI